MTIQAGLYIGRGQRERLLDNATAVTREKRLFEFPIVDVDAHHMDTPIPEIAPYLDEPWRRRFEAMRPSQLIPHDIGDRHIDGRTKRPRVPRPEGDPLPEVVYPFKVTAAQLGIDCSVVFPTDMLALGLHPDPGFETAMARAYARWMCERVLPHEPSVTSMLYLPFSDAGESLRMVEEFAERPGVVGFMVTSLRHQQVHDDRYMKVYAALEERGSVLGFHSISHWRERPFELFNNFLSAHALGFPFYNSVHLVNLVVNAVPERFPGLRFVFFEGGVAYLPQLLFRLDTAFMMRPSEAPGLKRKPSEYIREFYFSSQPLEWPDDLGELAAVFDMIHADSQLLYSSDYPHWDFDLPGQIYDLPFLSEEQKRRILGGNAIRLFRLGPRIERLMALSRSRMDAGSASATEG